VVGSGSLVSFSQVRIFDINAESYHSIVFCTKNDILSTQPRIVCDVNGGDMPSVLLLQLVPQCTGWIRHDERGQSIQTSGRTLVVEPSFPLK